MKYKDISNKNEFILDESNFVNAIALIKEIVDKDLDVELNSDIELIKFMDSPENFIEDEEVITKIKDLKELLDIVGGASHV